MVISVIGLGLIGGSMAKDLRASGFATEIIGVDNNPGHAEEALRLGIADRIESVDFAVSCSDIVILATPVDTLMELLPFILDRISPHTTVTDVGSTKRQLTGIVRNHPNRRNYVPAHPMAGTENSGPSAAIENLFRGKIVILCDQEESGPQHIALIEKMFCALGMDIAYMTSDEQDHSTAYVSHLPHVAAFALANAVLDKEDRQIIFDLASGGFNSTVRLAKSSCSMWNPIFEQNSDYMIETLTVYIKHLEQFRDALQRKESQTVANLILNANKIRAVLDGDNHQFRKNEETIVKYYTK